MVEKPPPSRARHAPMPPEPPLPDAPPPWLDDEPLNSQAVAINAAQNSLKVVPIEAAKPSRPLRSRSYASLVRILSEPGLRERVLGQQTIRLNQLSGLIEFAGRPLADVDSSRLRADIEVRWQANKDGDGMKFSVEDIERAMAQIADDNRYHPVQDYLRILRWDGKDRFPWLAQHVLGLGTAVTKLDITLLRKWVISAVARAREPGCKVDTVLVLVGPQGAGKSTFFRVLASDGWFCDSSFDPSTKDGADAMSGAWIYEWPELEAMQRARSQNSVKAFITTQIDVFRPPYGRHKVRRPRTCVIVGTSNDDDFLSDATGNRRYWPIRCGERIDLQALAAHRDQIWAQAAALQTSGEPWYLDGNDVELLKHKQAEFESSSAWDEVVRGWLAQRLEETLSLSDVMVRALELRPGTWAKRDEQKAAMAMRRAGWEEFRGGSHGGPRPRVWRRQRDPA